jgi:hypothetical protein
MAMLRAAFAVTICLSPGFTAAQEIRWHNDYAAAREEARQANKPILLEFRCSP